jgi:methylenetetrahydrofolate dehydrogenase (NADP+)/methenyltetrahydrofolate cyclohydrolase
MLWRMQRIDGKALALKIRTDLKEEISATGLTPKLGVLLVGDDPASRLYVDLKEKACKEVGISTDIRRLSATTPDDEIIAIIRGWNGDMTIHAVLIQLPLPAGHDTDAVISAIDPKKDADGFHPDNLAKLYAGEDAIISPVHEGVLRLIAATDVPPNRTETVVIANSAVFSAPLVHLLKTAGAFVRSYTPDDLDDAVVREARIIVVAVGRPNFLTRDLITSGACVIDVGTNKIADGKTVGDVDASHVMDIPGWISPVPGGVGPMTIALLLKNVVDLAEHFAS